MEFANDREHALAILVSIRYLTPLIRGFEDALLDAGFEIVSRRHEPGDRMPTPVLALRRAGQDLEMHLGNAIEDFLFTDREAEPVRIDMRVADDGYALRKLADVIKSRVEILEVALLPDGEERERRLRAVSDRFEWTRITRIQQDDR